MSVTLYDGTNLNGLFNVIGKGFKAIGDINTSRLTTVPTDLLSVISYFNKITPSAALEPTIQPVTTLIPTYQAGGSPTVAALATFAQQLTIGMVNADAQQADKTLKTALKAIIAQMKTAGDSVKSSTVTVTVTAGGSNVGDGVVLNSKKRGDGLTQENMLAETITGSVQSAALAASIQFLGTNRASGLLGQDWPMGSGVTKSLTAIDATAGSGSLLTNGGFETQASAANVPDSWTLTVGTPGTTCSMTVSEVQTVAISGTPTGAFYYLKYTDASSKVYVTVPLAYNASGSDVQSALRSLPGLSAITVVTTGTTPNYTHTITFTGAGGNITQLTSINDMTGGAPVITHGTTTNGTSQVFAGNSAVYFTSNGSELTTLQQQVTLQANTAYAISLWACCDVVPGAGVITIDLVDGVGGTVVADAQSVNNSITFNASALLTTWQHLKTLQASECVFRTPATLPTAVYLRIRISTAVTNTRKVFFDSVAMAALTEMYAGGPLLAAFAGSKSFSTADTFTVTTTNDRAGVLLEYMQRSCDLASLGLLLPSSGSPTIPDSVCT